MSQLRQRMVEEMQMRRFSVRTQESYLAAMTKLVKYVGKAPDQISSEEMRQYFLYLTNEKQLAHSSVMQAICGLKFFYEQVLKRDWEVYEIQWPRREKKLPRPDSLMTVKPPIDEDRDSNRFDERKWSKPRREFFWQQQLVQLFLLYHGQRAVDKKI